MKPTDETFATMKSDAAEWARERLADSSTVILDLETTGILSRDPDTEICQIAVTDTKGKPLFCMLLKPAAPMKEEVMEIHGIRNEQVVNQPMFAQVAKMIAFVLQDKHVIAYNMDFDWKLFVHMVKKYQCEMPKIGGASCAMDKYSEWKGEWNDKKEGVRWQKLPNLSGLPAHDAFSDCISTLKVMEMMAGEYDPAAVEADSISLDF